MTINGQTIMAKEFAYDNCHKIYLIESNEDRELLTDYGYAIYPIDKLTEAWNTACPLRFIESADLTKIYAEQGSQADINIGETAQVAA